MTFKNLSNFSKSERSGLLFLILLIIVIQLLYFFIEFTPNPITSKMDDEWLALQPRLDSLSDQEQEKSYKVYPFNPNFITDFKGYKLGMTVDEIDRLLAYRKSGKFVNSAEEFQRVTKVSDSLLNNISPLFKFPSWVTNKNNFQHTKFEDFKDYKKFDVKKEKIVVIDINLATKEDLMKVYGIGDAISDRILKQRESFGSFVSMEQMQDVWGLSPEVIEQLNKRFAVIKSPEITKIDINNASTKELMKLPYFRYHLAREIITYRSMNDGIHSNEDLIKIKGFPVEKVKIIALYLSF